jgi:hypothetical protein
MLLAVWGFIGGNMNADYIKLAQIAYDTVLQTMIEGEKVHGADGWKDETILCNVEHAKIHITDYLAMLLFGRKLKEDDIAHAMTRCAMIKYLENR